MERTYSTEQLVYMTARAEYETLQAEAERRLQGCEIDPGMSHEEMERLALIREQVHDELHLWDAFIRMRDAERALVNWSFQQVKELPQYQEKQAELSIVEDKWEKYPSIRQKVIDAAMRLAA